MAVADKPPRIPRAAAAPAQTAQMEGPVQAAQAVDPAPTVAAADPVRARPWSIAMGSLVPQAKSVASIGKLQPRRRATYRVHVFPTSFKFHAMVRAIVQTMGFVAPSSRAVRITRACRARAHVTVPIWRFFARATKAFVQPERCANRASFWETGTSSANDEFSTRRLNRSRHSRGASYTRTSP